MADFEPRLVGPVLSGTASAHSDINLHLFTESPEAVSIRLEDHGIPHEVLERRIKFERERSGQFPGAAVRRRAADGRSCSVSA